MLFRSVREFLVHILGSDPGIRVVGTAQDGEEALAAVQRHNKIKMHHLAHPYFPPHGV